VVTNQGLPRRGWESGPKLLLREAKTPPNWIPKAKAPKPPAKDPWDRVDTDPKPALNTDYTIDIPYTNKGAGQVLSHGGDLTVTYKIKLIYDATQLIPCECKPK
jgi:hypothetical protein